MMLALGVPEKKLLENTGLKDSDLLDPYAIIKCEQAVQYYRNLIRNTPSPGVGLEIGLKTRLSDFGSSGYSIMTTATVEEAIKKGHQHYTLHYFHVDWETEFSDKAIINRISVDESLADLHCFLSERVLTLLHTQSQELLGPDCYPYKLMLDFPDPGYSDRYREIFQCPVFFDCSVTEIHYPTSYLNYSIPTYDPQVHEVLEDVCAKLAQKISPDLDTLTSVNLIIEENSGVFPSIEIVAEQLGISSRTLSRKLRESGTSFQSLLDDTRRRIAENYLTNTRLSMQQIADNCGFRDAQNFSSAFKRWKGMSPSEYRKHCGDSTVHG